MVADVNVTGGAGGRAFDYMLPCVLAGVLVGGLQVGLFSGPCGFGANARGFEFELYDFWNAVQPMSSNQLCTVSRSDTTNTA